MGNTGRIIYMHVPTIWVALLALTVNFACSVAFLFKKSFDTDALAAGLGRDRAGARGPWGW